MGDGVHRAGAARGARRRSRDQAEARLRPGAGGGHRPAGLATAVRVAGAAGPGEDAAPAGCCRRDRRRVSDRYPQLLRTERHRWWKPLLGLAVAALTLILGSIAVVLAAAAIAALVGVDNPFSDEAMSADTPLGLAWTNLSIAMIIPAVLLAVVAIHRTRVGWLSSVEARLRWALLGRIFPLALVLVV